MIYALVIFVVLNILDGFTTWLCIYRLPAELRGREANIFYKDIDHTFWPAILRKGIFVVLALWSFPLLAKYVNMLSPLYVLNLVLVFVVVNNTYVYLSRRITKRLTTTPIGLGTSLLKRLHLSEKQARVLSFYILILVVTYLSYLIVGAIS